MKKITVMTPCYNEEENVEEIYRQVKEEFDKFKDIYTYEHLFIDNHSQDRTRDILRELASKDNNVKCIFNAANFGAIRSPYYALCQSTGDAVIYIVADLQEPPQLIPEMLKKWEEGHKVVACVNSKRRENPFVFQARKAFYRILKAMSETKQIENFNGFGLYDKSFIQILQSIKDPYPYLRGLVAEYGCNIATIDFYKPKREKGKSSYNFYRLYDFAMVGFVSYSKLPLRLACFIGFSVGVISLIIGLFYLVYKLLYWDTFQAGSAPLVVGMFFVASVQLFFLGIVGEYVGNILTQVKNHPLVVEEERINF